MTDYVLGADLSRWQGDVDFGRLEADGVRYVIIKATEGTSVDAKFERNRNEAIKRGMLIGGAYPFLRPTDTQATIDNFLSVSDGFIPALDYEQPGVSHAVAHRWVAGCESKLGREGLGYYGLYPPDAIEDVFARWPRWFPQYPGNDAAPPRLKPWDGASKITDWRSTWLIWQYTGSGRLPGIAGTIDLNRLCCPLAVFSAWIATGNGLWENPWTPPVQPSVTVPEIKLGSRDLHLHSTGSDVGDLQLRLNKALDGPDIDVDFDYELATREAVRRFQVKARLVADGWAGVRETIPALIKATS